MWESDGKDHSVLYFRDNEGEILHFFQESSNEQKDAFLKSCLKPESQLLNPPFLIDFGLFNEETQSVIITASQFLGLDSN